jgi:hypothetical protein
LIDCTAGARPTQVDFWVRVERLLDRHIGNGAAKP